MTTLYIAEKPSLGRTIAQALGGGRSRQGLIHGNGWIVTWCIGHLYEQAMPEDYDKALKKWTRDSLPIVPEKWKLKPKKEYKEQIAVIKKLLANATQVVHCGDPDREGQLLVDEVLEKHRWRGPVDRAWLPDLTDAALNRALTQRKNNTDYRGLGDAARERSHADWLVGMNLSRAMTLANRQAGGDALISIGRVQTPTLKLVVDRDRLIENFVPQDYFVVLADFDQKGKEYCGIWQPRPEQSDAEGRCLKRDEAEVVAAKIKGEPGDIVRIDVNARKEPPPLPFSLNELQQSASRRLGFSAQRTLDIAQALYERHKLITYPRTDCRYLASAQHAEVPAVLAALKDNGYPEPVAGTDPKRKGRAFNDKKITAHSAIIPTANHAGQLSDDEAGLYRMVVYTYLAQFYPDHRYQATQIETRCLTERFISKGKQIRQPGWKELFTNNRKNGDDDSPLPFLEKGEVECRDARAEARQTKPPAPYTEGTLIKAMANVARFVEDEKLRKVLRENQGIGTEATRAGIIETLKKRNFLTTRGKTILSTQLGRQVIDQIPEQLGNPAITAWWEQQLTEVERGNVDPAAFEARAVNWLNRLLLAVDSAQISLPMHNDKPSFKKRRGSSVEGKGRRKAGHTNRPTPKMIAFAEKIASKEGVSLPRGCKSNFGACKRFLDDHTKG
jgi:DNA topoisomerase-3